ncbi:hypothetical protein Leryth_002147 [Lithospermum erythrorhizon]|nr:hypothetical protein Leryth_002147 [Lithospermum erythrorhizon]
MATIFSPSALLSSSSSTTTTTPSSPPSKHQLAIPTTKSPLANLTASALAATILTSALPSLAESSPGYTLYYGTAASAANYGGYGGNSDKKTSAEYIYDVPQGWKERLVSKVEKGTNGTDSEFYNPKKKTEKETSSPVQTMSNLKKGRMKMGKFIMYMRSMELRHIV